MRRETSEGAESREEWRRRAEEDRRTREEEEMNGDIEE